MNQPTWSDLYKEQLAQLIELRKARTQVTQLGLFKVVSAAQVVLSKLEAEPALRDPFLVSLLIDGLKYRESKV